MRWTEFFLHTRREAPADISAPGLSLLIRAGMAHATLNTSEITWLPAGVHSLTRLAHIVETELANLSACAAHIPTTWPARMELISAQVTSYRHLPALLTTDHLLHRSVLALQSSADALKQVEFQLQSCGEYLFQTCGLRPKKIQTVRSREWLWFLPSASSEQSVLACPACGYAAVETAARFRRPVSAPEELLPVAQIATPDCKSIQSLADFLNISARKTAKAVFLTADIRGKNTVVFAVVRGDRDVSEALLAEALGADSLRPASDAEITACGAVPGYASPIGVRGARIILDPEVLTSPNLVAGANIAGYHLLNVNAGRDYTPDLVTDIALAQTGDACLECGTALQKETGITLGGWECPAAGLADRSGCRFIDEKGKSAPVQMGAAWWNLENLLIATAERWQDDRGLCLPQPIAPFDVHLVCLNGKNNREPEENAARLYHDLRESGLQVLWDDRAESPGVKFNDADLIGIPIRLTVSERSLRSGGIECRSRRGEEGGILAHHAALNWVRSALLPGCG